MPMHLLVGLVLGAAESQPHYHTGKLTPYEIGPPSLLLSAKDEGRLRSGKAVMQALVSDDGQAHRMIMVQDIPAPSSVVMGCAPPPRTPRRAHPPALPRPRPPARPTAPGAAGGSSI
jgi:hypothetical protein